MPTENLEYQYDQAIKYFEGYRQFVGRIVSGLYTRRHADPQQIMRLYPLAWRELNPLSGRNALLTSKVADGITTEEERASEYYPILVSKYPLHELSVATESKFGDFDFEKLMQLHELKKHQISRFKLMEVSGIVLAGVTLLLNEIPESVVSRVMDFKKFELVVFGIAAGALLVFLILVPLWWKYNRARTIHEYAGDVIEYTAIRLSQQR